MSVNSPDTELLSAYIDGELTDAERLALEIRLDAEPDLRRELTTLRQTVALINQLPKLKAPRDFTLTVRAQPTIVRKLPLMLTSTFSALSAAAAFMLVLFGGYLLLGSMNSQSLPTMQSALQITSGPAVVATLDTTSSRTVAQSTATAAKTLPPAPTPIPQGGTLNFAPSAPALAEGDQAGGESEESQAEMFMFDATDEAASSMGAAGNVQASTATGADTNLSTDDLAMMPYATATVVMSPVEAILPPAIVTVVANEVAREQAAEPVDAITAVEPETTAVAQQQLLPTLTFPSNAPQPTALPDARERVSPVQVERSTVALIVLGLGLVLLVVAVATTIARRNRLT